MINKLVLKLRELKGKNENIKEIKSVSKSISSDDVVVDFKGGTQKILPMTMSLEEMIKELSGKPAKKKVEKKPVKKVVKKIVKKNKKYAKRTRQK